MKNYEEDSVLDKFSVSDYISTAALLVIREAEGPNLLDDITYGRKDVQSESEAGSTDLIPSAKNYRDNLKAKGFEDNEIVALAAVESFVILRDPKKSDSSKYPKLDNFLYKQLAKGGDSSLVLQQ